MWFSLSHIPANWIIDAFRELLTIVAIIWIEAIGSNETIE